MKTKIRKQIDELLDQLGTDTDTSDESSLSASACSALSLVANAWAKKKPRPDLNLEFAAIIKGENAIEIATELEYIASRIRETGWSAGSGGGKPASSVWEMFKS